MPPAVRLIIGPCLVCGGRPLKNGRRRHNPEVHEAHRKARRRTASLLNRQWPRNKGRPAVDAFWARREPRTDTQTPTRPLLPTEWVCKVLRGGMVVHVAVLGAGDGSADA